MEFAVLGPLLVQGDNGPIDIAGAKERTLLAHLVARAGQTVSADALVDSLWGEEPPRTAAKSLQTYVLRLRNVLEPERNGSPRLLVTEGRGYRLAVPDEAIDAWRFGRLVELGQRAYRDGRADSASATLGEALALWRGAAYSEFEWTTFGGSEARRLEELRLVAEEDRIAAELDLGRAREAVPELESLTHQYPMRERLWSLLVLSLYRSGRQGDALAAYGRARDVLVDELGVEPGEDLRQLHARVLMHDAGLHTPRTRRAVPVTLTPPPGAFVGRQREVALLRDAWSRAVNGEQVTVVVRGRRGAGARRLAGEIAVEVAEQGGVVEHVGSEAARRSLMTDPQSGPSLLVLTDSLAATLPPATEGRLVLVLAGPTAEVPAGATRIDLEPLSQADVRLVLGGYLPDSALDDALPQVMRDSGGLPGRVHDAALSLVRQQATARVGVAAQRADEMQQALGSARHDLRDTVTELGEVQDRLTALPPDVCPWRGLVAYDVQDAPWFAGRERLVAELLVRVASAPLIAVVGASGSGKSSLARAGLVAALEAGSLPGSESWVQLVMRPGPHPMRELARIALRGADPSWDRDRVADQLERLVYGDEAGGRVVLVVDQLEELWTTCTDPAERAAFLDTVADLLDSGTPCTVVLVVRADYVAELADHPVLASAMADATLLVGAPTAAEVRRAVERPAQLAGLRLELGLTDAIVDDAGDEPGSLPLLSTAMTELWDRRAGDELSLSSYVTAGGLDGAVTRIAERVYGGLADADQRAARVLLLRLAGPGDGDATTRQRVRLDDLAALPDIRVRAVVDPLADARLLSVSADQVEVAHEALFREWPRLRGWLEEDTAGRGVQRRLSAAAHEWDANRRDAIDLWRGARLDSGLDFASRHPDELTDTERSFLDAGQAQHDAEILAAQEQARSASRQNRRLKWLLGGLGIVLVSAIVAGALAITASARAERETRAATARELSAASLANLDADPELSMLLALEAIDQTRSPDGIVLPEAEEALHRAVGASRVVMNVPDVGGSVDWSPRGDVFVTEGPENSGVIDLRDAETGESVRLWPGHEIDINDVAFSSDGSMLATSGDDGAVRVWDPGNGQQLAQLKTPDDAPVWNPTFSHDGSLVAATWLDPGGGGSGFVSVLDVTTGEQEARFGPFDVVGASAFDPVGSRLAISAFTDAETGLDATPRVTPFVLPDLERIGPTAWSPDGSRIATRGAGTALAIRNAETGAVTFHLNGHTGTITDIEWSADSTSVATSSEDKTVRVWDLNDDGAFERLVLSGSGTASGAQGVALSPDASRVMAGDLNVESVTIWDITDTGNAEIANLPGNPDNPTAASFTPDGRILANRGGGSVTEWDPASGAALRSLDVDFTTMDVSDNAYMEEVIVSHDGDLVAYAVEDVVSVRDARTDAEIVRRSSGWFVLDLAWSPVDEKLAVSTADGLTVVLDRDGQQLATLNAGDGYMSAASNFSADGRLLAVATQLLDLPQPQDSRIQVWDWQAGDVVTTIQVDADDVEFDPTGTLLVSGGSFEPAGIWQVPSGEKVRTLTGVGGGIGAFAISPDGSMIAGGRFDGAISIWDTDTGSQHLVLTGHQDIVINVEFSPDGASLLSSGFDGVVRVWATDLDDLIAIAHDELTRGFTDDECRQYLHQDRCEA